MSLSIKTSNFMLCLFSGQRESNFRDAKDLGAGPNYYRGEWSCLYASGRIGNNSCNCCARLPGSNYGCCSYCNSLANVPDNACNTGLNGAPINADDSTEDGKCKYCVV